MNSVSYGNNMWVAVGKSGTILTSSNGTSWIKRISNTTNYLASVVYGNGIWVSIAYSLFFQIFGFVDFFYLLILYR